MTKFQVSSSLFVSIGNSLYLSSNQSDVSFVFESADGSIDRVPAQKHILSAVSDVFNAMFFGSLTEKTDVKIKDASPAAFREFLRFFYFEEVELSMENIGDVLNLGHKYNVDVCVDMCIKIIGEHLSVENVCLAYRLALLYEQVELMKACEDLISSNTASVFKSSDFLECDQKTLTSILKLDFFSCAEIDVFVACMEWVKAIIGSESMSIETVRCHLDQIFYEIRYTSLSIGDFASLIESYGYLFTVAEYAEITQMIGNKEYQAILFNGRPRKMLERKWDKLAEIYCNRFTELQSNIFYFQQVQKTMFSSTKPLLLGRIRLVALFKYVNGKISDAIDESIPISARISVAKMRPIQSKQPKTILRNDEKIKPRQPASIQLSKPVYIEPHTTYQIRVMIGNGKSIKWCTNVAVVKDVVELPNNNNSTVTFHNERFGNRNIVSGLVFNSIE